MATPASEYHSGRGLARLPRPAALGVVVATYLLAAAAAAGAAVAVRGWHPLAVTLVADVAATGVVFAVSMLVDNASLYDPYWSVAPPIVVAAWAIAGHGVGARQALVLAVTLVWSVRLTGHWWRTWAGLGHEDWRYRRLRATRGRIPWWLVDGAGIQLMPTLVVLAGLLAVWPALAAGGRGPGALDALAGLVAGGAVLLEATADRQLRRFAADPANRGLAIGSGLWRYSRHPNYLGEILFWWGLWLAGLAADPSWWWTVAGPLAMVALFTLVSVPMMDRRSLARRPGYAEVLRTVPALAPWPGRRAPHPRGIAPGEHRSGRDSN